MHEVDAVKELESLMMDDDREHVHWEADRILLAIMRDKSPLVAQAYERVREEVGFWYA